MCCGSVSKTNKVICRLVEVIFFFSLRIPNLMLTFGHLICKSILWICRPRNSVKSSFSFCQFNQNAKQNTDLTAWLSQVKETVTVQK